MRRAAALATLTVLLSHAAPAAAYSLDDAQKALFGNLMPSWEGWECVLAPHDVRKSTGLTFEQLSVLVPESADADEERSREQARLMISAAGDTEAVFLTPEQRARMLGNPRIGVQAEVKGGALYVHAVEFGSPAQKAGLRPGDQILAVGGTEVAGLPDAAARGLLFPDTMSPLRVTARRHGAVRDRKITPVRAAPPELSARVVEGTLVVRITYFGRQTADLLRSTVAQRFPHTDGMILDLRGNAGGFLSANEKLHSLFFPKGTPYIRVWAMDDRRCVRSTRSKRLLPASYPVVVLADAGTANGAELVAAALQESGRAVVVGERTWGLGRVEKVFNAADGTTLRVRVGLMRTPEGKSVTDAGVKPDVRVAMGTAARDRQLMKALDIVKMAAAEPPPEDQPPPEEESITPEEDLGGLGDLGLTPEEEDLLREMGGM